MKKETQTIEALEMQAKDIAKRLREEKKKLLEKQAIAGQAVLEFIEEEPESQQAKMLMEILTRKVTDDEDKKKLNLAALQTRLQKKAAA